MGLFTGVRACAVLLYAMGKLSLTTGDTCTAVCQAA